ncbi:T9SS C-terminal target domain-containing protein [Arenibacter algicola]|uniref:T9SS C-terminal target domain-containing protein n=1 Tax=Arenibacter algicola TaxID=616991 RepID=UPI0004DFCDD7|nr:T9SS C-terminal target domain-containing protein [Arenibacter algicola]
MKHTIGNRILCFCCSILLFWVVDISAQSGVAGNFGVHANIYSGEPNAGNDDWFAGNSGLGVIDESSFVSFQGIINSGQNTAFQASMAKPNYSTQNGRLWYGANFGHDYIAEENDKTAFSQGQNGDNPANWQVNPSKISKKADIVDSFVHVRRDGANLTDDLWVTMAVSTSDNGGAHYTDVEFFIEEIQLVGNSFSNLGQEEGHTAWQFDNDGKVTRIGDLDVGFDYSGSSVMSLDVRIWVSREDYVSNTGFTYNSFDGESGSSVYGYAHVDYGLNSFSKINSTSTTAPPWGTYKDDLTPSSTYGKEAFAEVGLNFTGLGFDPAVIFGLDGPCYFPFSAVLIKTRGSSSFSSGLVDFAGPYPFLGTATEGKLDTSILGSINFDSCNANQTIALEANFKSSSAVYYWKAVTPDVTFPDGSTSKEGVGLDLVDIESPGTYTLNIAPCPGCTPDSSNATSITVYANPCANDDQEQVTRNKSVVIQVLDNDIDLDNNININSIGNVGLLQPANGTVTISTSTAEIMYTPNTGYLGTDTFEYKICDTDGLCDVGLVTVETFEEIPPPFIDSDNDGILDRSDLDDDNDGIPDIEELNTVIANSQPQCGGETTLDFSANAVLLSGTALQQGAVYRIPNVTSGTDALITIAQIYNATVTEIDNNSMAKEAFRPYTAFNFANKGDQGLIEYKIRFVTSGGSNPVVLDKIFMNFNDIDGTHQYGEQTWSYNPTSYVISSPTELTMSTDGKWVIGTAGTTTYPSGSNIIPQVNFGVNYNSRSEISIRVGAVARVAGAFSTQRQHNIEFGCVTNYIDPRIYGLDNDWDGVTNQLDLDVDNDGIYDAEEAGHNQTHTNGVVDGPYGLNGLADSVESALDNGIINYVIDNTDGTAGPDYMDADSDDDGCSDANEAYNNPNSDQGDNPFYGTGAPPKINSNGIVMAATYPVPADVDGNGVFEFQENTAPYIVTQPIDKSICPGNDASFSVLAANTDTYQWQWLNGSVWEDLLESGTYSGTKTNVLDITNALLGDNGNSYRVVIANATHICPVDASTPVKLNVLSPPSVVANASATVVNAGETVVLTGTGANSYIWDNGASDGAPIPIFSTTVFTVIGTDANGCEGRDTITIVVNGISDLSLAKTADNPKPNIGEKIIFSLTLTNNGPEEATNVIVEDQIPVGYTINAINDGGVLNGNSISWTLPSIAMGTQVLTYELIVNAPTGAVDEYKNIAQITSVDQIDPDSSPNNDDNDQSEDDEDSHTIPTPTADINVSKTVDKQESFVGDTVTFTIDVVNNGNYSASNIIIQDILPSGYDLITANSNNGSYNASSSLWEIPFIDVAGTATLQMLVTVLNSGDYTNIAKLVKVDQLDSENANDQDEAYVSVVPMADISLKKTVNNNMPNVGEEVVYTLTVANDGPDKATNLQITDILPLGITVGNINDGGVLNGNTIIWNVPSLEIGSIALTYEGTINIPQGVNGEYKNIAQITKVDQLDMDSAPNNDDYDQSEDDEDSHTVGTPIVDLETFKTVVPQEGYIGDEVVFTVRVINHGPYVASHLGITEELPAGYDYVSSETDNGTYDPTKGIWTMDTLGIEESSTLEIKATITELDDYVNVATLAYVDQLDFRPINDSSMAGITLIDLEVKEIDQDCMVIFNEFSPNNDGLNDVFFIECIESYPNNYLQIFNRWGQRVFETTGYKNDWHGTVSKTNYMGSDKNLPVGTYFYLLDFGDGITPIKSGWLYISR